MLLLLCLASAGCSAAIPVGAVPTAIGTLSGRAAGATPGASIVAPTASSPLTAADAARCPVTKPIAAPANIGDQLFGSAAAFGNRALWVGGLGADGIIRVDSGQVEGDGSLGWKLGWWRIVPGRLLLTGRRLDAAAPALRASVPEGYGATGFQASGVWFPAEGCWEVTGTVEGEGLSFVTFVLRD